MHFKHKHAGTGEHDDVVPVIHAPGALDMAYRTASWPTIPIAVPFPGVDIYGEQKRAHAAHAPVTHFPYIEAIFRVKGNSNASPAPNTAHGGGKAAARTTTTGTTTTVATKWCRGERRGDCFARSRRANR